MSSDEQVTTDAKVLDVKQYEQEFIQNEIEIYTKKIEHEKINLRLSKERSEKQFAIYSHLQGMPVPLSKEQKEKERREKREKNKKRKYWDPITNKQKKDAAIAENISKKYKEISKHEQELDNLNNEINVLLLENKDLKLLVENLRKEKFSTSTQLDLISEQNKQVENSIEEVKRKNKDAEERIQRGELEEVEAEGNEQTKEFSNDRDKLEEKYHGIIEANIKREREHKKELSKKRQMLGMIADAVKNDPKSSSDNNSAFPDDQAKLLEEEDISDRTPILDMLIEKWKFINKHKRQMIDKYIKNANSIREAFDKMMKYLGVDDYQDLPVVFSKMEEQMSSIEMYLSKLTNEIDKLDEQKMIIQEQIRALTLRKNATSEEKCSFQEMKHTSIARLNGYIEDLKLDIDKKRQFFQRLQPETDEFLSKLHGTYMSEYVPDKIVINKDVTYNETNIIDIIANVEDYFKLIEEFDKSVQEKAKSDYSLVNKDIDRLRNEMRNKLEQFKKENYINTNLYTSMKVESKSGGNFDETIKKLADVIVSQVNTNSTQMASSRKKK